MKKLTLLIVITTVIFSCNRDQDQLDKDISLPVTVMEVSPGTIQKYVEVTGNVVPMKKANLTAENLVVVIE